MSEEIVLSCNGSYVGNCMLFWAEPSGYTTDLNKAQRFGRKKAESIVRTSLEGGGRRKYVAWVLSYLEERICNTVDMQRSMLADSLFQQEGNQ